MARRDRAQDDNKADSQKDEDRDAMNLHHASAERSYFHLRVPYRKIGLALRTNDQRAPTTSYCSPAIIRRRGGSSSTQPATATLSFHCLPVISYLCLIKSEQV
jgi:hypothetical protein